MSDENLMKSTPDNVTVRIDVLITCEDDIDNVNLAIIHVWDDSNYEFQMLTDFKHRDFDENFINQVMFGILEVTTFHEMLSHASVYADA